MAGWDSVCGPCAEFRGTVKDSWLLLPCVLSEISLLYACGWWICASVSLECRVILNVFVAVVSPVVFVFASWSA